MLLSLLPQLGLLPSIPLRTISCTRKVSLDKGAIEVLNNKFKLAEEKFLKLLNH